MLRIVDTVFPQPGVYAFVAYADGERLGAEGGERSTEGAPAQRALRAGNQQRADDADHDLREHAVFSLSESEHGGDAALIRIVRGDYPRELKKTAEAA